MREEEEKETIETIETIEKEDSETNGYLIIGASIWLLTKALKLIGISINDTLQWLLFGVAIVLVIIGTIKYFIERIK